MGNEASLPMEMATNFDAEEIKRLGKRFKKLDLDNSGSLSVEEFMSLPELQQNPLVQRVIDIFDEDGNGEVDFKEFIQGVSQFSVKGDKSSKLRFAFRSVAILINHLYLPCYPRLGSHGRSVTILINHLDLPCDARL